MLSLLSNDMRYDLSSHRNPNVHPMSRFMPKFLDCHLHRKKKGGKAQKDDAIPVLQKKGESNETKSKGTKWEVPCPKQR